MVSAGGPMVRWNRYSTGCAGTAPWLGDRLVAGELHSAAAVRTEPKSTHPTRIHRRVTSGGHGSGAGGCGLEEDAERGQAHLVERLLAQDHVDRLVQVLLL